jgi:hypothetical protein
MIVCLLMPDSPIPQFLVSIICVAIALPVTLFLENLFEKANEVEGGAEKCARHQSEPGRRARDS